MEAKESMTEIKKRVEFRKFISPLLNLMTFPPQEKKTDQ